MKPALRGVPIMKERDDFDGGPDFLAWTPWNRPKHPKSSGYSYVNIVA